MPSKKTGLPEAPSTVLRYDTNRKGWVPSALCTATWDSGHTPEIRQSQTGPIFFRNPFSPEPDKPLIPQEWDRAGFPRKQLPGTSAGSLLYLCL